MFKKGFCFFLALLMAAGICACSKNAQSESNTGTSAAQSQVQSSTTAAPDSQEESTASQKKDKKSTTRKQKKSTAAEKTTTVQQGKTTAAGKTPATTKAPATTAKKPTTKQPTSKKQALSVTFTIDCSQAVGKVEGLPKSGYFLKGAGVSVSNGANVYEALVKCCDANGVDVVASQTMYGMYVSAIGGLAEKDTSKTSGWTYTVNGKYPPKACDKYALSDGDSIVFIYKV